MHDLETKDSISTEDYLKTIYKLMNKQVGAVKTQDIASKLNISAAAVTDKIKKLSQKKLLDYVPYKGVTLRPKGIQKGKSIVRRHRIIELYLNQRLDVPWHKVHEEAEVLEHFASDYLINKMDQVLGFPSFDPHGAPIPREDGEMPSHEQAVPLSECAVGDQLEVVQVSNGEAELLCYLDDINMIIGQSFLIKACLEFDGTVQVEIKGRLINLSSKICQNIWVKKI